MIAREVKVDFVKWFSELSNKDVPVAGGKGASLGEMFNAKIPVPPGFVVTAQAYDYFIHKTGIADDIKAILARTNVDNTEQLNKASRAVRDLIEGAKFPLELEAEVVESYEILSASKETKRAAHEILQSNEEKFVAVRSSATTEDLADASFAGQQETFLNVHGKVDLLDKVKKCMSSLFTARAIYYRVKKGFEHDKALLSVVVQIMVNSEKSGVMFSKNPVSAENNIVIEAVWGLGEGIVSGQIKPDHYVVASDLDDFKILQTQVSRKNIAIIKNKQGKNETIQVPDDLKDKQVLNNYEIRVLAQLAKQLEHHYKKPQDIEFAISKEGIFVVQSRPITTSFKAGGDEVHGEVLLSGLGASPGVASGKVKIIHDLSELEKIQQGDVLVTEMTNPDMVVSMQKAAAIITDEGGVTSHAAIVSREMGIPAVVGTTNATKKLKDGDVVTVDGNAGKVVKGRGETKLVKVEPIVPTRTEIKVIVDLPEVAERAALSHAKSVGLVRLEGIIAAGGKHPFYFVENKNMQEYTKLVAEGIEKIAHFFQQVWVRTSDLRSDEYSSLEGAPKNHEGNPMLGDHGVRFSLKHPDIMKAEILALKQVALKFPEKKFGIMVPQVISVSEVKSTKDLAHACDVPKNVVVGIMVETPAAVQIIEDVCKEGISFISFGTNDLTQYTLAIDRNNESVQSLYTEMHPAVLSSIRHVIRVCKRYNVFTSLCGQAGSREDMATFLIQEGINSISVNADSARKISELVARLESQLVVDIEPISSVREEREERRVQEVPHKHKRAHVEMEEEVLKALDGEEGDYSPSIKDMKQDIPALNDAIPVGTNSFADEDGNEGNMQGFANLFGGLNPLEVSEVVEAELTQELVDDTFKDKKAKHF